MSYTVPLGPYHPALEEPCRIDLDCEGETVRGAEIRLKFNFRGVEWLAERKNFIQAVALIERVCGICSNVHAMTFCRALETLAGVDVPERARHIRLVVAELERVTSHLLWTGLAAEIMGFQTLFMACFALRERAMDVLEGLSGNRVNYGMNRVGGVTRDIADPGAIRSEVLRLREETLKKIAPVFLDDRTVRARCAGIGVLSGDLARAWGAVGPTARASGVPQDIRKAAPYEAYGRLDFHVPLETAGDVNARVVVRLLELIETYGLLEQALGTMPGGPLAGPEFVEIPAGEATARSEAPRGECFYYVAAGGAEAPLRVKIRTPSFVNMPLVAAMVRGANLADVPLINASIDPCYSCTCR
ncbi:MAG TPA: nickel-dependent hydrogenase large subunit [Candidatus Aminicenantes bacterium]|nr:nickel-dependent hydrogenase large subunit [Candidatus Aminicenantes bacterium]HRY64799.1 nickel-dependent hydrogenase large subunit [Candidatus Aminicenantes bacterium]HRZ71712.1 nickel-dependent hydrogenase large subunit [Candidatus Aminicenantes bacterium]